MSPIALADIRRIIANDGDGRATQAVLRWLREASQPVALSLHESFSQQEQQLARELQQSIARAERGIIAAWEEMHPGRRWQHEQHLADVQGERRALRQS